MRQSSIACVPAARWTVIVLSLACLTRSVAAQPTPAAALVTGRVVDAGGAVWSAPSVNIVDVLRTIPSFRIKGDDLDSVILARGTAGAGAACIVRLIVDGHLMPLGMPLPITSPKEVRAMEVYAGPATMPLELVPVGAYAYFGLIVVWTK